MSAAPRTTVVVVTGLSGAGKTQGLNALEDLGFFCIDNLPTQLAPRAVELCEEGGMSRIALGIDVRVRAFLGEVGATLATIDDGGRRDLHVLFFDASDETLLRRFSETRRPHPHSGGDGTGAAVLDGVRFERERLAGVRARATRIIDTTNLSVHELRRAIIAHLGPASGGSPRMHTRLMSFGFKYGPPVDADLMFDVRFLENPYFVPELKPLTGLDLPVARYVLEQTETKEFMQKMRELLAYVMPKYEREGKSYLTIGIGCTGGRHRSVAIAEAMAPALAASIGTPITVVHRDIERRAAQPTVHDAVGFGAAGEHAPPSEGPDRSVILELKGGLSPVPPPFDAHSAHKNRGGR